VLTALVKLSNVRRFRPFSEAPVFACTLLLTGGLLPAQDLIPGTSPGGTVRLFTSDAATLESPETRKDLPCTVTPDKPQLGFDLKFHAGYEVTIGLKDLAGEGNQLTMIFRVTAEDKPDDPMFFSQHVSVPAIDEDERGPAFLQGAFDVGEGKYHVDWLMRDRAERICSAHWDAEANLAPRDKQMGLNIAAETVAPTDQEPFRQEPPVERESAKTPISVRVMMNFAPQDASAAALQPVDTTALVSILRSIARDPRIGTFSLVAYNLQEQRVIYRQEGASQIDFPSLGKALNSLNLGTVDLKRLTQKHGDSDFLGQLITAEVKDAKSKPDAVIFAGPKVVVDETISVETLKQLGDVKYPVFYMNYNLNPQANPWRDAIGNAVRYLKGAEYTISRPRDLFFAWTEIMGRIVKSKVAAVATGGPAAQ
jgi:hypothetical protein